ncbi:hypothetical protein HDU84_006675 [Entophlyctis sp. JEL0112]|nr:hypothetical protein HDU84_006675 [Entophlyctis sp. JEL0112]
MMWLEVVQKLANTKSASVAAVVVTALLLRYLLRAPSKSRKVIPGPKGYPLVGMLFEVRDYSRRAKMYAFNDKIIEKYGRLATFNVLNINVFVTADHRLTHRILTETANFRRGPRFERVLHGVADNVLFAMQTGDLWKKHRKYLQPAFAPAQLRYAAEVASSECNSLVDMWKNQAATQGGKFVVDIFRSLTALTLDIIGLISFSHQFHSVESFLKGTDSYDHNIFLDITRLIHQRTSVPPILWKYYNLHDDCQTIARVRQFSERFFNEIMQSKNKFHSNGNIDLLDRLLASDSEDRAKFTKEEIFGEVFAFVMAGHETTANTLTFTLMEISKNSEIQRKLKAEVSEVLAGRKSITADILPELKYLDCVIKESQRFHTVVPTNARLVVNDVEFDGYTIPAGSIAVFSVRRIHRDPSLWENPDEFIPERWLDPTKIVPNAYLPFGEGPHNCIGQKLALIEMKVIVATLLNTFTVEFIDGQNLEFVHSITYGLKNGLKMALRLD